MDDAATEPQAETRIEHQPLAYCGERVLNNCKLHDGRRVHFDGDPASCPACKERNAHAKTRGALNWSSGEIARLKKLEQENRKLQSRIFELEDRLPEEDFADDQPIKEPQRSGDTGAGNGPDVFPRTWR